VRSVGCKPPTNNHPHAQSEATETGRKYFLHTFSSMIHFLNGGSYQCFIWG